MPKCVQSAHLRDFQCIVQCSFGMDDSIVRLIVFVLISAGEVKTERTGVCDGAIGLARSKAEKLESENSNRNMAKAHETSVPLGCHNRDGIQVPLGLFQINSQIRVERDWNSARNSES